MDQASQIRESIDIVAFISEYMPLKRAGRNFKANCPFHTENSPSFVVSPERQIWHCFGCQKGGDIYTFLMEYEHIEFIEALRFFAKRLGVVLESSTLAATSVSKKEKIYELNKLAAELYHYILVKHPAGKKALEYVAQKRKIKPEVIDTFQIGFAPSSAGALTNYLLKKKKYKKEELFEAGLAVERYGRVNDFFIDRLMFPLIDHKGNIVGFSGRIFDDKKSQGPKYINTKETLVYHKGSHFFGLNQTAESIRKNGKVIVVEGEFDVLSCFQAGVANVVALKGTAFTQEQVNLLSRFTTSVALCLDQDAAGKEAMKRSLALLEKKSMMVTIVVTPNGKDPDESIQESEGEFKKAVKEDVNIYDYLFEQTFSLYKAKTAEGKKQIAAALLPFISQIENEIIKEHFLKKLSTELDTSIESIIKEAKRFEKKETIADIKEPITVKKSRKESLEEYLLALLLQYEDPKIALSMVAGIIRVDMFSLSSLRQIYEKTLIYAKSVTSFDGKQLGASLPSELQASFNSCCLFPLTAFSTSGDYLLEIEKKAKELQEVSLRMRLKEIGAILKEKEHDGNEEEFEKLQNEFSHIAKTLKRLS